MHTAPRSTPVTDCEGDDKQKWSCFSIPTPEILKISEAKIKEGIFIGPQIRNLFNDVNFDSVLEVKIIFLPLAFATPRDRLAPSRLANLQLFLITLHTKRSAAMDHLVHGDLETCTVNSTRGWTARADDIGAVFIATEAYGRPPRRRSLRQILLLLVLRTTFFRGRALYRSNDIFSRESRHLMFTFSICMRS
ncbi:hypothetical protein EVAR_80160_1 [Eumeta japonica]|uniref:Uncharacterized protein n=1 Tax=Eumeta variegata TaxID=151549 RepID=A0A4C1YB29_EUMVA|nr:hypothetical protein EVAR_80160_1 [Eumeta japonica]